MVNIEISVIIVTTVTTETVRITITVIGQVVLVDHRGVAATTIDEKTALVGIIEIIVHVRKCNNRCIKINTILKF